MISKIGDRRINPYKILSDKKIMARKLISCKSIVVLHMSLAKDRCIKQFGGVYKAESLGARSTIIHRVVPSGKDIGRMETRFSYIGNSRRTEITRMVSPTEWKFGVSKHIGTRRIGANVPTNVHDYYKRQYIRNTIIDREG